MQINSLESMKLARDIIFEAAGQDWDVVREAATRRADGVLMIDRERLTRQARKHAIASL